MSTKKKKKAARRPTKKSSKKKASKKKASKKKASKKKASKKKASRKKASTKKASTKKASTKKTTTVAQQKKVARKKKVVKKQKAAARAKKIAAAAFSGDGRVLATAVGKRVLLWDVFVPSAPRLIGDATTQVEASRIAVDATGSRFAAAVAGFSDVRIRSAQGALLNELRARGAVTCFAFAPDGRFVLGEVERIGEQGLHARSFITVFDLGDGSELFRVPVVDLPIRDIVFSSDGLLLFLGFGGGVVVVFDLEKKRELFRFPQLPESEIGARIAADFAFSADGRRAAIQWGDVVEVWPVDGGERIAHVALGARTWSVALNRDGTKILCGAPAAGVWSVDGTKLADLGVGHHVVAAPDGALVLASEKLDAKGPKLAPVG
jgi:WD40 repeat protein